MRVFAGYESFLDAEIWVISQCASSRLVNVLRLRDTAVVLQLMVGLKGAGCRSREIGGFVVLQMILTGNVIINDSKVLHAFALDKSIIRRIKELDATLLAKHLL